VVVVGGVEVWYEWERAHPIPASLLWGTDPLRAWCV